MVTSGDKHATVMIFRNRRIIIQNITSAPDISEVSAHSTMLDILGFQTVCETWVLKESTEEHEHNRLGISSRLLKQYQEGDNFFNYIITGDETWIHH
jgi:hypothetical protein